MANTWELYKITGGEQRITSITNSSTSCAINLPQNTTSADIEYEVRFTDENGCTAKTTASSLIVPKCDTPCYEEWDLELIGSQRTFVQTYTGTGGTPFVVSVEHNGEKVQGLTSNDFVLNIGPNGAYNEIFTGIVTMTAGENYLIYIDKANENVTCPYVGDLLQCTLAPTACTEAKVEFNIILEEKISWITQITGMAEDAEGMSLGYCCKLSACDRYVKLEFDDWNYDSSIGALTRTTPLLKNTDTDSLMVTAISQLPSTYNQAPYCFRIESVSFPYIKVHYCSNCTESNPCNPNYEDHCI